MARKIKLTKKQFTKLLTDIIKSINNIHGSNDYSLEFSDSDTAYITRTDNFPFYITHLDTFTAILTLYDCSMWFDVRNGKPCMVFMND